MARIELIRGDITAQAAATIAMQAIRDFSATNPEPSDIRLIAFDNDIYSALNDALRKES